MGRAATSAAPRYPDTCRRMPGGGRAAPESAIARRARSRRAAVDRSVERNRVSNPNAVGLGDGQPGGHHPLHDTVPGIARLTGWIDTLGGNRAALPGTGGMTAYLSPPRHRPALR